MRARARQCNVLCAHWSALLTAALSMESLGWKLLGPSSHRYSASLQEVMLPPTRSLASVTSNLQAYHDVLSCCMRL